VLVGVKVACNVCPLPACKTVPAAGVYVNVPATLAVALSCVDESAVPYVIPAGADHVIVGEALATLSVPVALPE